MDPDPAAAAWHGPAAPRGAGRGPGGVGAGGPRAERVGLGLGTALSGAEAPGASGRVHALFGAAGREARSSRGVC